MASKIMFKLASAVLMSSSLYACCWDPKFDINIMEHPAKNIIMSKIRDKNTSKVDFVHYSNRLLRLLLEYTLGLEPTKSTEGQTSTNGTYENLELLNDSYTVVVILRAGASMLGETQNIMPQIKTGFILIQRNESASEKDPIFYYSKLPTGIAESRVLLVDPMLATGGSVISAISELLKAGVKEENIVFINLISCAEGINAISSAHPNIKLVTAQIDPFLNEDRYIVPGLGDFGDRYYGTDGH